MTVLYNQFFRNFVLRKKQDLVQPNFHSLSDIVLPKESLIHYVPDSSSSYGPRNEEAIIGTYPDKVNIFFDPRYDPVIGKYRQVPFNNNEAIKAYRKGHYKYVYARQLATFLSRRNELLVNNLALGSHHYTYMPSRFVFFDKAYNQLNTLISAINARAEDTNRHQFVTINMPESIPNYTNMRSAALAYERCFKDSEYPVISNLAILPYLGYGAYWLIDWLFFLQGKYEYSQFSKLTDKALTSLHFIFTSNGRAWVINLGLLKGWLDELNDKDGEPKASRINVTKRILLVMKTLIENLDVDAIQEVTHETVQKEEEKQDTGHSSGVGRVEKPDEAEIPRGANGGGASSGSTQQPTAANSSNRFADLYVEHETPDRRSDASVGRADVGRNTDDSSGQRTAEEAEGDSTTSDSAGTLDWTSPVDDSLLDNEEVSNVSAAKKNIFVKPESGVERALEARAKQGNLTVAEQAFFRRQAESYKHIRINDEETLETFVKIPEKKLRKLPEKVAPEMITMTDKSMVESRVSQLRKNYAGEFLERDIAGMVLGIQNAGIALTDFKKTEVTNALTAYDIYTFSNHPVDGAPSTRQFRIPRVGKDGTYTIDGVKQQLQFQRMEIPIRKINSYQVALTSYYDRGLMVTRSQRVDSDYGRWLKKQITAESETGKLDVTLGNNFYPEIKVPRVYSILAQRYRSIKTKDYSFIFDLGQFGDTRKAVELLVSDGTVPVARDGNNLVLMDEHGNLTSGGKNLGTIESALGINTAKAPVEICTVNIGGFAFPIGVVLCFYFGIDNLLKTIKAEYRSVPAGERLKLTEDEYAVTFSDESLIFNRRDRFTALIMGGFIKLPNLANFSRFDLNGTNVWVPVMGNPKVKLRQFEEMRLIFDMFIDPVTKGELIKRHYPTEMHYLLLEAVKMLTIDYTKHEVEISEQRFVGYERFAGKIYEELVRSTRQYRNKGNDRRHTLDLNPEAIMMNIIKDASVNQVEEVNPIHEIKEQEAYTFGGSGGRSETTMVRRTRGQQENYRGIVSEAGKDSGKVGFVGYLTSNPKIADYRGNVDLDMPDDDTGLLSVTGNLLVGSTRDDPKRSLYASVQQSQGVSAVNYTPSILRTGYEVVVAHRTSELYSKPALKDGKIVKLDKRGMVMEYEDGTTDTYPLGLVVGKAAGELHRHTRVTDLKVGDAFKAGEILGWDDAYFERDLINKRQVVLKVGVMGRVALTETQFTFEDSVEITEDFADATKTPYLKSTDFGMGFKEGLNLHVKIGDEVEYDAILCTIDPEHLVGVDDDGDFIGLQERHGLKQIRANHHGKVVDIVVTYNGDPEKMTDSLKTVVLAADRERKRINEVTHTGIVSGDVGGNTAVGRTAVLPERVSFEIIIEDMNGAESADKFVYGNQMKGTVGNIVKKAFRTLDGRPVVSKFSFKGLFNRMVLSLRDKMAWGEVILGSNKAHIKAYRGK